jgi:hypothetical protein
VPPARAYDDRGERNVVAESVRPAVGRAEPDLPADRVVQVDLSTDDVRPVRCVGVFEIGEPDVRPGVQGVDRHLLLGRTGDLDPPVLQVCRRGSHPPARVVTDLGGLGEEVEASRARYLLTPDPPALEQLVASGTEACLEIGQECERLAGQDVLVSFDTGTRHRDVGHDLHLSSRTSANV